MILLMSTLMTLAGCSVGFICGGERRMLMRLGGGSRNRSTFSAPVRTPSGTKFMAQCVTCSENTAQIGLNEDSTSSLIQEVQTRRHQLNIKVDALTQRASAKRGACRTAGRIKETARNAFHLAGICIEVHWTGLWGEASAHAHVWISTNATASYKNVAIRVCIPVSYKAEETGFVYEPRPVFQHISITFRVN